MSRPGAAFYGFQLSVRDAANAQAGALAPVSAETRVVVGGGVQYIEHTLPAGDGRFTFDWTPPPNDAGPLTVYVAANAANGNGLPTGDQILLRDFALQPEVEPGPGDPIPTLAAEDPVVNGASFTPGITAGSWVTIFGTDLAPTIRNWDSQTEIVNGRLPTELDGVSVRINGKAAAVYYISPTQLNVQAPDDEATGPVMVEVTVNGMTSAPGLAQIERHAPAFFLFDQGGRRYLAAVHGELDEGRVVYVGPNGLFGDAALARPVKAGDIVLLFGTGFGPTDPPVPAGQVYQGAAPLVDPVTIRFGDVVATEVDFAGVSGAGMYQFNVHVPGGLPEGDVPVTAEIGGRRTQIGVFIPVDH